MPGSRIIYLNKSLMRKAKKPYKYLEFMLRRPLSDSEIVRMVKNAMEDQGLYVYAIVKMDGIVRAYYLPIHKLYWTYIIPAIAGLLGGWFLFRRKGESDYIIPPKKPTTVPISMWDAIKLGILGFGALMFTKMALDLYKYFKGELKEWKYERVPVVVVEKAVPVVKKGVEYVSPYVKKVLAR